MKKFYMFVIAAICTIMIGYSQVGTTYSFAASSGTYTDIAGGTGVATSTSIADFLGDTKTSVAIPIGFSFTFDGTAYTQVVAASDGFLSFNTAATSTATNNLTNSTAARRPLVAPLWDDLDGNVTGAAANYITTGTAGSQVFTIEWKNWQWNYAATGNTISFQVKLYEGTNKIEFIYRQETGAVNSATASIGIAGSATGNGNYLSLNNSGTAPTVSSTTETVSIATKPATGQVYTFTPIPTPAVDLSITAVSTPPDCQNANYPVVVTIKNTGLNAINFATANATVTVNVTGAATQALSVVLNTGTLAPNASQNVTITPGANLSTVGAYTFNATVAIANDGNSTNNTGSSTTTIADKATPAWSEPFSSTTSPAGWNTSGWTIGSTRGVTGNPGNNIYKNLYGTVPTGSFTTIAVGAISSTDSLKFDYKTSNYASPYAAPDAGWGYFLVQISSDCGGTFTTIDSIFTATASFVTKGYALTAYAGQTIKVRISAGRLAGDWDLAFDNFKIETALPCATPSGVTVGTVTNNSASVTFTGTGNSYIVEYGPTGFTPGTGATAGGGTIVAGTTSPITIAGLSASTAYQVYVRQNCSAANNGFSYNSAVAAFTTTVNCTVPTAVSVGSVTATTASVSFTSTGSAFVVEYGATGFTPGTGATAGTGGTIVTGTASPIVLAGLSPNTSYQVYVRQNCSAASFGYSNNTSVNSFTTLALPPANDLPSGAITLTVDADCTGAPYTNAGGTLSANEPRISCKGSQTAGAPVWFKFVAPAGGFVRVSTDVTGNGLTDTRLGVFSAADTSLASFQIIACDDDNGVVLGNSSIVYVPGLTAGQTYYVAVDHWNGGSTGTFCVQVHTMTTAMLATTGTCNVGQEVNGILADYKGTVSLTNTSGLLVANVRSTTTTTSAVTYNDYLNVNTGAVRTDTFGTYYLNRNFRITNGALSGNFNVQLFFLNTELAALQAVAPGTTLASLNATKVKGESQCNASFVSGGSGNDSLLVQSSNGTFGGVSWINVNTPGFSNFYLHATNVPLPITFEYLKGKNAGTGNALNWKVNCTSVSVTMVLERSADARKFDYTVTSITASRARCGQPFDATDAAPLKGTNYYRLKMIDVDGKVSYSPVVAILNGKAGAELVGIYPTVVRNEAYLSVTASRTTKMQIAISDMSGKVIRTMTENVVSGSSVLTINTNNIASGVYNITGMLDGVKTQTLRFIKE